MIIEDREKTQKSTRAGRKPAHESREREFCQTLIARRQMPEASRPSLHELARELGTSHQMLAYYANRLDTWQAKENTRRIRARAKAEGRPMTMRECCDAIILPGLLRKIEELRQAAKRGPLNHWDIKMLNLLAKRGFSGAKEVLVKCRQMTPEEEKQARASERAAAATSIIERIKQDAERSPLCWQDIERLKYFARRKWVGTKELLEKYSKSAERRPEVPQ